jgi:hypothetical protein
MLSHLIVKYIYVTYKLLLYWIVRYNMNYLNHLGEVSPDIIKTKKSELRLYCDLLMQQVHSVKSVAQDGSPVNVEVPKFIQDLSVPSLFVIII